MYYVYVLRSLVNGDLYVGSAENIAIRLKRHNDGKVRSTKGYRPWEMIQTASFQARSEAVQRERFLKTGQQKEILKEKYGPIAK